MPVVIDDLAAAAATAQFIEQGLNLVKWFYSSFVEIKEAPENVKKDIANVEQLIGIARLIQQNKALQTDSIHSCLRSCLNECTRLDESLKAMKAEEGSSWRNHKHWKKAFTAWFKKEGVNKAFGVLESQKTIMLLAMVEIDS